MITSKKYLSIVASILIGIAVIVFALSQFFISGDKDEIGTPYMKGPTSLPYVTPPTTPPPTK
jgi:hypothetical protein